MKTKILILAVFGFLTSAMAEVPVVEDNDMTSAGLASGVARQSVGGEVINGREIEVFWTFGPGKHEPMEVQQAFWSNAVSHVRMHDRLPEGTRVSNTDVRSIGAFTPEMLMTSASPFYYGTFNPTGVWENAHGATLYAVISATAGTNELGSIAETSVEVRSNDELQGMSTNILGKSYSFGAGNEYSATALGINPDGTIVANGTPAHVAVKRVIFAVPTKSFSVSTASDVQKVRNFLNLFPEFEVSAVVNFKGSSVTSTISKAKPRLTARRDGNKLFLAAEDTGDFNGYMIQRSVNLVNWTDYIVINPGDEREVDGGFSGSLNFFRLKP